MSSVGVVVPCYNYARYLRECVESVLAQERVDVQVLIIDDCSSDDTPQVAAKLVAKDSRVEYRRHEANQGHIATYNEGLLGWASSDYCLLLSADDVLAPGALARAAAVLDAHPQVVLVYGNAPKIFGPAAVVQAAAPVGTNGLVQLMRGAEFVELLCRTARNPVPTATAVVRTETHRRVGGYLPQLPHSGDMEMWMRLATEGGVAAIDIVQARYRIHGQNMSFDFVNLADLRSREAAFSAFFTYAARCTGFAPLRSVAMRSLADASFWAGSAAFDRADCSRCAEYLEQAAEWCPQLQRTPQWFKLQLKRAIGVMLWSQLRPLYRRLVGS